MNYHYAEDIVVFSDINKIKNCIMDKFFNDDTTQIVSEPETTEMVPSIEPNPVDIPVATEIPGEMPVPDGTCCPDGQVGGCNINVGKFFGTLMESVKISWQYHLKAKKHSEHVILEEYYDSAQELVDSLIEEYQGVNGVVDNYDNCVCGCEKTPVCYFTELRVFVMSNRNRFDEITSNPELGSDIDSIMSLIDSTLYKLTNLTESVGGRVMKFDEFVESIAD